MTPRNILRRAGYAETVNREGEVSYTLRLGRNSFPRFHVYVEESKKRISVNVHLDQKAPSYTGSHAHSGEYDGKLVEEETSRVKRWFDAYRKAFS